MLDSTMLFLRKNRCWNRRWFSALLLAAFAVSAFFGPLAHAYVGEDILTIGQDVRSDHPVDQHALDHGHSHDMDWPEDRGQQHSHDHNPIDHSHEIPGIAVVPLNTLGGELRDAYPASSEQHHGYAAYGIDRPPRR